MNIRIRSLKEKDAETSYVWRNNPEIWKFTGSAPDHKITLEDERNWIRKVIADPTCRRFAILADETYVGNIYLTGIAEGEAEYHVFLGELSYAGKGIAKQASLRLIDYARKELKLHAIRLEVKQQNDRAVGLYEKLGFTVTGRQEEKIYMRLDLQFGHTI